MRKPTKQTNKTKKIETNQQKHKVKNCCIGGNNGRLCIYERGSEVRFPLSPGTNFFIFFAPPEMVFVKKPKKLYGEFIFCLKPFKMILSWGHVTGNKSRESGLFCSSNLETEFYEKWERGNSNNMDNFGQNHSEIEENISSHIFWNTLFQARRFILFFFNVLMITSLIFKALLIQRSTWILSPISFRGTCFHIKMLLTQNKTSGTTSYPDTVSRHLIRFY